MALVLPCILACLGLVTVALTSPFSPLPATRGSPLLPWARTQPGGSEESAHGLVTIRMKPDEGGKFGFNVKGGADQNLPLLVSRVAPNTPADRCYPRLNEGDQVRREAPGTLRGH